jgi:hypothetical protein
MRIKGQAEIDISISDEGYIVLKQRNGAEEPHVIEFAPAKFEKAALVDTD